MDSYLKQTDNRAMFHELHDQQLDFLVSLQLCWNYER